MTWPCHVLPNKEGDRKKNVLLSRVLYFQSAFFFWWWLWSLYDLTSEEQNYKKTCSLVLVLLTLCYTVEQFNYSLEFFKACSSIITLCHNLWLTDYRLTQAVGVGSFTGTSAAASAAAIRSFHPCYVISIIRKESLVLLFLSKWKNHDTNLLLFHLYFGYLNSTCIYDRKEFFLSLELLHEYS